MSDAAPHLPSSLDVLSAVERRRFEKARCAFEQGDWAYALSACVVLLAAHPECLPVRRLQREVLLKKFSRRAGLPGKLSAALTRLLLCFGRTRAKRSASEQIAHAEIRLGKNPYDTAALRLLGEAASELGWVETAVFAYEAIWDLEPTSQANLLALGEALLSAHRAADALKIADTLLAENPVDSAAKALMRKASIAQTLGKGNWEEAGDFRAKLKAQ